MKNIGVVFGSVATEHDVSITTGYAIMSALLKSSDYKVIPLYIDKKGVRYTSEKFTDIKSFAWDHTLFASKVSIDMSVHGEMRCIIWTWWLFNKAQTIDIHVIIPALHGQNGEDGAIMWLCNLLWVPYAAPWLAGSSVGVDKIMFKQLCEANHLPIVPWVSYKVSEANSDEIESRIPYPCIVKPNALWSSIGVSKVRNKQELLDAIELVGYYDEYVIIEKCITDLVECNCCFLPCGEEIIISEVEQIRSEGDLLDFQEKYISEGGSMNGAKSKVLIPAPIEPSLKQNIQSANLSIARMLHIKAGAPRVDYLIDKGTGERFVNEINTIPWALQMHLWFANKDISPLQLLEKMIEQAEYVVAKTKSLHHTFDSSIVEYTMNFGLPTK